MTTDYMRFELHLFVTHILRFCASWSILGQILVFGDGFECFQEFVISSFCWVAATLSQYSDSLELNCYHYGLCENWCTSSSLTFCDAGLHGAFKVKFWCWVMDFSFI